MTKLLFANSLFFLIMASAQAATQTTPHSASHPAPHPITLEELGKTLYFDPRLSPDGTISCNSCHNVMMPGGDDGRAFSMGIRGQRGGRSSPSVFTAPFMTVQFWDGRAKDLEDQAKGPLVNPVEMGNKSLKDVIDRLTKIPGYVEMFDTVFKQKNAVNVENMVRAIAAYEKSLATTNSRYDKFIAGDKNALTNEEQEGYKLFQTTGCVACHSGTHFAGPALPTGQGFFMKFPTFENTEYDKKHGFTKDMGRFQDTKKAEHKHFFRVPSLRNVGVTAPYFHNGAVVNLEDAVKVMGKTQLNKDLTDKDAKLIAGFLKTLTSTPPPQTMPLLPASEGKTVIDVK